MSDQQAPLFTYLGLYKFGKEKSKIKLNKRNLILFVIIFAAIIYLINLLSSCLF
ncbi:MAG: hypothetical protein ACP5GJ_00245 [Nanopusillaceae archaeon]